MVDVVDFEAVDFEAVDFAAVDFAVVEVGPRGDEVEVEDRTDVEVDGGTVVDVGRVVDVGAGVTEWDAKLCRLVPMTTIRSLPVAAPAGTGTSCGTPEMMWIVAGANPSAVAKRVASG